MAVNNIFGACLRVNICFGAWAGGNSCYSFALQCTKVAELRKFGSDEVLPEQTGTHKVPLKSHPTHVVESKCFRAVQPPPPSYHPALRPEIIRSGSLSDIQYESVVYAGMRHSRRLGDNVSRAAYFIGDGTGIGKGRQLAAIILVHLLKCCVQITNPRPAALLVSTITFQNTVVHGLI